MKKNIGIFSIFMLAAVFAQAELKVNLKVGTGIQNREPIGVGDSFPSKTPELVVWTQVLGATAPREIWHIWALNGKDVFRVRLWVKSSSFRTWSRKTLLGETGHWTVRIKDDTGNVLATTSFKTTAP